MSLNRTLSNCSSSSKRSTRRKPNADTNRPVAMSSNASVGSVKQRPTMSTSDQAFEVTAKLVADYLSPKLVAGASTYHVDMSDTIFLDAVVPQDIRKEFVQAVEFRSKSLPPSGELSPLQTLVKECSRLGLGKTDCFLLGGGMKMDDGRTLVFAGGSMLGKKKKSKKKKKQTPKPSPNPKNNANGDMAWLANSGLPADQMQLIMSAMSNVDNTKNPNPGDQPEKTNDAVVTDTTVKKKVEDSAPVQKKEEKEEDKIEMNANRRTRTTKGKSLPPIGQPGQQTPKIPPRNPNKQRLSPGMIMPSASNVSTMSEAPKLGVIGGPPPLRKNGSSMGPQSDRALNRRMRSLQRRSKIQMYEESFDAPLQTTWRDGLWDFAAHGICHKFLLLSFLFPLRKLPHVSFSH